VAAEKHCDVVIVGGGVAGTSCALECFDIRLDTLVYEADAAVGGQIAEIPHSVRNVLGWQFPPGGPVRRAVEASVAILDDRLRVSERVSGVDLAEHWVEAGAGRVHARAIVLATGTRRQELAAAPDGAFGGDVTYLVESDPGHFTGRDVVVVGGGDSGTLDALELAAAGSTVTLVHRGKTLSARDDIIERVRAEARIHDLPGWEVDSLEGGDRLEAVVLRGTDGRQRRVPAGGLVVKIARVPNTELVRGQLDLDRRGAIVVDAELRTSQPGVFAAGDVAAGAYPRIAVASGSGVLAARSVQRTLRVPR
jgi:thioredoxin reductase (NADPH)